MSKIWEPQSIKVYQGWINALNEAVEDDECELSQWEEDFVDSLQERLNRKVNLTERQAEILETIYVNKTK